MIQGGDFTRGDGQYYKDLHYMCTMPLPYADTSNERYRWEVYLR